MPSRGTSSIRSGGWSPLELYCRPNLHASSSAAVCTSLPLAVVFLVGRPACEPATVGWIRRAPGNNGGGGDDGMGDVGLESSWEAWPEVSWEVSHPEISNFRM
jgi:hypothetical protein